MNAHRPPLAAAWLAALSLSVSAAQAQPPRTSSPNLCVATAKPPQPKDGAPVDFPSSAAEMTKRYETAEKRFLAAVAKILARPTAQRNFSNTVRPLHDAQAAYTEVVLIVHYMKNMHPDKCMREAAEALETRAEKLGLELADREDLYQAYKDVAAKQEPLTGEDKKLLDETLRAYTKQGMGLPRLERDKVKAIRQKIVDLSQAFAKNLAESNDALLLDKSQLAGLPEDFVATLQKTPEGKYRVTLDYPTYIPFMRYAQDAEARRQLQLKYDTRGGTQNVRILEQTLALREELAQKLGRPDFSHLTIDDSRMAKSPEAVTAFLNRLKELLSPAAAKEREALLALKREEVPGADKLESWDFAYYENKLRQRLYGYSNEDVRQYFPVPTVVKGMLGVFEDLYQIKLKEVPAKTYHPDVKLIQITDAKKNAVVGHIYLDLYPREGKYKHMAAGTIVQGRMLFDGDYRKPVSAMMGNFSPPARLPDGTIKPGLLTHREVETFAHEFGHLLHQTLTKARYTDFSGTSVARDFVEAPSQMAENFIWDPAVLSRISGHWQDPSKKLPKELLDKMLAAKQFNAASFNLRQVALATFDQAIHSVPAPIDTSAVMAKVWKSCGLPLPQPGSHFQGSFGHLMAGYEASYYAYLWSLVYAQDIFSRFEKEGILSPKVGADYRRLILERGSSVDEARSLREFLGREPNEEAFLKSLGVPIPKKQETDKAKERPSS